MRNLAPATSASAVRPPRPSATAVVQAAFNVLIVVLFLLAALSSYRHFADSGTFRSFGVLAVNTLFVVLFLGRRRAKSETDSLPLWALAVAGTALPLLMRATQGPGLTRLGTALQLLGLALVLAALLSLRRSFAVVPGNRGIRDGGLYRIVRHPMYFSELTVLLGVVLANPTGLNAVLFAVECALQYARAHAEERFLAADPAYRAYRARVRYRLIPGLV